MLIFIYIYKFNYQGEYQWYLVARRSLNENGCSQEGHLRDKHAGTFEKCKEYCKDAKFLQVHENGWCSCFQSCDFERPVSDYHSPADVYEKRYPGVL